MHVSYLHLLNDVLKYRPETVFKRQWNSPMEIVEVIHQRKSTQEFKLHPTLKNILMKILKHGCKAP